MKWYNSPMLSASNVSFSYGYGSVFEQVNFLVGNGKKIGIVGPNGAGKSTLFKLLTKQEFPSTGKIAVDGTLMMVEQEVNNDPHLRSAQTIDTYVDPTNIHEASEIERILRGLEFDRSKAAKDLNQLSGGQKTKLALARAFLAAPDILLLDEPTNFLDEAGKKWVMHFLAHYPKTVLIISHDLQLLDKHISQVFFINQQLHRIDVFAGNYSQFVRTKKERDDQLRKKLANDEKQIKRLQASAQKLKQSNSEKKVHQGIILERRVERIKDKLPPAPAVIRKMKAVFPEPDRIGEVAIRANNLSKSFGQTTVLRDIDLYIKRGERFALIGHNGAGKTTLIKLLTQTITPDTGEVIHSESLNFGYYSQEFQTFDDEQTLEEIILRTRMVQPYGVTAFLGRFLFSHDRLHQKIGSLSGGEKTRLSIALLMLHRHNLLVLDEPTTYLDVLSQRVILEALKSYTGAMLIVSHTKEFVSELRPHRALLLPQNKTVFWTDELGEKVTEM